MVKYHPLTWIGIVGGAITLFANFKDAPNLADWARKLAGNWQELNAAIWAWLFGTLGIEPSEKMVPTLTFAVFIASLVTGLNFSSSPTKRRQPDDRTTQQQEVIAFLAGSILYTGLTAGFALGHDWLLTAEKYLPQSVRDFDYLAVFLFPTAFLIFVTKERGLVIVASLLFFLCVTCLVVIPALIQLFIATRGTNSIEHNQYDILSDAVLMMILIYICQIGWMAAVLFSPIRPLIQGLTLILIGTAILTGLAKGSKMGSA
jgi:hypothetical protein